VRAGRTRRTAAGDDAAGFFSVSFLGAAALLPAFF
jgi:hypothetical protein